MTVVYALAGTTSALGQSCSPTQTAHAFSFTGGDQSISVPGNTHSATVYLKGAQGGVGKSGAGTIGGSPLSPGGAGGLGGQVSGSLTVAPGDILSVGVGGRGSLAVNPGGASGTPDGGNGGGATDLRLGGTRLAIAGGGGGGGNGGWHTTNSIAGGAGGKSGGSGSAGTDVSGGLGPFGGEGGTVGAGGAIGAGCDSFPGTAGQANGQGGTARNFSGSFLGAGYAGGGGGGATVGGGGGGAGVGTTSCQQNWNGAGGGGGGGSSDAGSLQSAAVAEGVNSGDGSALICFDEPLYVISGTASGQTGTVSLKLTSSSPAGTQTRDVNVGDTTFAFADGLLTGSNWSVEVTAKPADQTCTVTTASGTVAGADVTNLVLSCTTVTVEFSPATLPNAHIGTPYSQTITASSPNGGAAPYTFTVVSGSVPPGLALSPGGTLAGTPTVAANYDFTVRATDSNGFTGQRDYTVVVEIHLPSAQDHTLDVMAGTTGSLDLTQGATDGPFTSATIASPPPSEAGTASIVPDGGAYILQFAAAATFAGTTSLTYTLSNADGTSPPATVTINVTARPDPSRDPEVIGLIRAQVEAAKHFADIQIQGFGQRLEQLHNEGDQRHNSIGLSVAVQQSSDNPDAYAQQQNAANDPALAAIATASSQSTYGAPNPERIQPNANAKQDRTSTGASPIKTGQSSTGTDVDTQTSSLPAENPFGELAFWSGGYVNFGTDDDGAIKLDHTLVGVSVGADYRFSPTFTAGLGFGYGHDVTDVGSNGTESRAHAISVAAYSSYRPAPGFFVDGLAGYGALNFDSERYVTDTGDFASGTRDGSQVFGSLTAGYEFRRPDSLISPYGRLSGSHSTLDGFTETGGDIYNLTFGKQTVDTLSGTLGLRIENNIPTSWGLLTPRARFEYTHDFAGSSRVSLGYADIGTTPYALDADAFSNDYLSIGLGVDAQIGGIAFGLNYSTAVGSNGDSQDHTIAARIGMKY